MYVERTYLHKEQTESGKGEYVELKMRIIVDDPVKSDSFENWSTDDRLFKNQLSLIRKGSMSALSGHGLGSLTVALVEHRWSDVDTPEWLFEQGAKNCVDAALEELRAKTG